QASVVARHLAQCAACAAEAERDRRLVAVLEADRSADAPDWLLRRAFELMPQAEAQAGLWERVLAVLTFDSRSGYAPAGARDAGSASVRLAFQAGDARIDLLCEREDGRWRLIGQVSGAAEAAGWTVLDRSGDTEYRARTGADGEFGFRNVAPGLHLLTLRGAGREIELPTFTLE
ncbi:MAG TPA: carboxypeptidase-like regulatory domain-containing protein, partial [Armatimonadota bacterium]|nr:carboxypeptidase-like regulatory domain-containing protein [Armatimonadota bacterium]